MKRQNVLIVVEVDLPDGAPEQAAADHVRARLLGPPGKHAPADAPIRIRTIGVFPTILAVTQAAERKLIAVPLCVVPVAPDLAALGYRDGDRLRTVCPHCDADIQASCTRSDYIGEAPITGFDNVDGKAVPLCDRGTEIAWESERPCDEEEYVCGRCGRAYSLPKILPQAETPC